MHHNDIAFRSVKTYISVPPASLHLTFRHSISPPFRTA